MPATKTIGDLREERADLHEQLDEVLKVAERENRDLRAAERQKFDRLEQRVKRLDAEIGEYDREHPRSKALERSMATRWATPQGLNEPGDRSRAESEATLGREQRMADWAGPRYGRSGFDDDDARDFSLGRVVRGMVTGNWDDADLEKRALAEGVDATGGFLTPEILSTTVIDRVRNQAKVIEAGARTVPLESDQESIPRLATGVTGAWRAENAAVIEQDATFERVTFRPKSLAVLTRLSYELFQDMTSASAGLIETELVQALSLELDRVALRGTGTDPEPRGVRNQSGVEVQSLGTNGATPTNWSPLVNAVAGVQADNIEPNAAIYSSRTAKTFASLTATDGQPLNPPVFLSGLRQLVSNQLPNTLTQGSNSDNSEIYVGDFSQLLIGVRPSIGVQVQRLTERFADNMQIGLLAYLRADIQLMHPQAFVVVTGVRAA